MSFIDNIINEFDIALKTLSNKKSGTSRGYPAEESPENLTQEEKDLSIQLMRVNLAGEVAAQALYRGQAMVCEDDEVKEHLINAGLEETDHLIWCKKRLDELGGNGSLLNPIWYAGSFALGAIFAGWFGYQMFVGYDMKYFWGESLFILPEHHAMEEAHHVADWVKRLPVILASIGFGSAIVAYLIIPSLPKILVSSVKFSPTFTIRVAKTPVSPSGDPPAEAIRISPGFISTAMTDKIDEKFKDTIISKIPASRLGKPEDVANAVVFLVSPDSDYINGETIHVNGGLYLG